MTHFTRRAATFLTALGLAVAPVACGGGEEEPAPSQGGGNAGSADGRELFATTCGGCHTLAAAETGGSVGPNLDEIEPDREEVLRAIEAGPGTMPEGLYEGAEAEAVADFVAQNAGR